MVLQIRTGVLIFVVIAFAAIGTARPQLQPKPAISAAILAYFAGNWHGSGTFATGKPIASDMSFVPDLENQGLLVRAKERPPNTFQYIALWSTDSASGDVVMMLASNHQSGARLFRSGGWQNGTIAFQSVPALRATWALERFTFTRKTEASFAATYEFSLDNGVSWKLGDSQTFTRTAL